MRNDSSYVTILYRQKCVIHTVRFWVKDFTKFFQSFLSTSIIHRLNLIWNILYICCLNPLENKWSIFFLLKECVSGEKFEWVKSFWIFFLKYRNCWFPTSLNSNRDPELTTDKLLLSFWNSNWNKASTASFHNHSPQPSAICTCTSGNFYITYTNV